MIYTAPYPHPSPEKAAFGPPRPSWRTPRRTPQQRLNPASRNALCPHLTPSIAEKHPQAPARKPRLLASNPQPACWKSACPNVRTSPLGSDPVTRRRTRSPLWKDILDNWALCCWCRLGLSRCDGGEVCIPTYLSHMISQPRERPASLLFRSSRSPYHHTCHIPATTSARPRRPPVPAAEGGVGVGWGTRVNSEKQEGEGECGLRHTKTEN